MNTVSVTTLMLSEKIHSHNLITTVTVNICYVHLFAIEWVGLISCIILIILNKLNVPWMMQVWGRAAEGTERFALHLFRCPYKIKLVHHQKGSGNSQA